MKDLTKGNIYKTFILFAVPMVLSGVLSQCYAVINTIIAGKLLGESSLAVIGALSPLDTFISSVFWGYGTGVAVHAGQLFGAKKFVRMKSVIINNFVFISAVLMLLSSLLLIFRNDIYSFLKIDPQITDECNLYFIISTAGKFLVLFSVNCVYIINAMGDSSFPFFMSIISTVLNVALGTVTITVFKMGVEGLALGNCLSALVVSAMYIFKFSLAFKRLNVRHEKTTFSFKVIAETSKLSVSTMVQQSIMYFAGLILSPMVNGLGGAASASYTVSLRIYDINASIYQNSAKTLGNYTAQCFGAKKYNLLKKGLFVGFVQNLLFVLPFVFISSIFARPVAMLFYSSDAIAVSVDYTVAFARYCLPFLVFNIVANLFHHFFRGIGHMKALLITTLIGSAARILISWLLIEPLGIYGYYIGWVVSWLFDGVVGLIIYLFGKWRKRILCIKE